MGPLIDRIDIVCQLQRPSAREMLKAKGGMSTSVMRDMVVTATAFQSWRQSQMQDASSTVPENEEPLTKFARIIVENEFDDDAVRLIEDAMERKNISMRGIASSMRVARTIADLDEQRRVGVDHVLEALTLRDESVAT